MQVNVLEAKNQLSQLIKSAQAGVEVVIANRGTPAVRLVPAEMPKRTFSGGEFVRWLETNPLVSHRQSRDRSAVEAAIKAERDAWD
jgi:prevent-host-death family protein